MVDSMKNLDLFDGFFGNRKILITGHTGFKGSWLTIWLNELGANVIGYALDPRTSKDNFLLSGVKEKIEDIRADIRDYQKISEVINKHKPEIIFHLAAQPIVKKSYLEPLKTYETNVMGTVHLLEAARQSQSVKVILNITSDKCYENKEWLWGYRENDPMGGYDPYSSSKGCSELITKAYIQSFHNPENWDETKIAIATVRAGNVIGGGDWAEDRIMTDCINALKDEQSIEIRNPYSIRPWQYVLEPLRGYLMLSKKLYQQPEKFIGAWNFGPDSDNTVNVGKLVKKVIEKWGKGDWTDISGKQVGKVQHEAKLLKLDISKANYLLQWKPCLSFEDTLKFTIDWYKTDEINYEFDVQQIKQYCSFVEKRC